MDRDGLLLHALLGEDQGRSSRAVQVDVVGLWTGRREAASMPCGQHGGSGVSSEEPNTTASVTARV
jgi:hypothetical protein